MAQAIFSSHQERMAMVNSTLTVLADLINEVKDLRAITPRDLALTLEFCAYEVQNCQESGVIPLKKAA